jgi:nitrogen regulatory protein P-II 2
MPTHAMKRVTVVCEALSREPVTRLLREAGAQGYTLFPVEGLGDHGARTSELAEFGNIQIEAIVPAEVCERLLAALERDYFPHYAMIAYETDVRVRRPAKFDGGQTSPTPRRNSS